MRLGVNIDHVATVRQARRGAYPDVAAAAREAEAGGADFITAHLREDRRHIVDADLTPLKNAARGGLNLELAAAEEMVKIAAALQPAKACLVPERREELTTEGGLDVAGDDGRITRAVGALQNAGAEVSLFVEADAKQIEATKNTGADAVELHTGGYANAANANDGGAREKELAAVRAAAKLARRLELRAHAGHGLNYNNVAPIAAIGEIVELNIGHAIVARALFVGMRRAVQEMVEKIQRRG